jgi:benzoyl-CoA reductase/2-hydroxyglutaryl-CoA dehydratase subunit BcrC/BadD/HgdB
MVLGSGIDDPGYLDGIESVGASVVADRFCFGSAPGLEPIPVTDDPIATLAEHTLRTTQCPRMMGAFDDRVAYVLEQVAEYAVDGVILETMKFCDLWGVEGVPLTSALRAAGLPTLRVDRDYARGGEGQLKTRVQAFLESMGR